ncbi:MAG: hypothetical protein EBU09_05905 [Betaproteobacteria bacterium]|nr:hypothetical protein [Betaproteobacteria bacterium]
MARVLREGQVLSLAMAMDSTADGNNPADVGKLSLSQVVPAGRGCTASFSLGAPPGPPFLRPFMKSQ